MMDMMQEIAGFGIVLIVANAAHCALLPGGRRADIQVLDYW
jgi:hypothetical protein